MVYAGGDTFWSCGYKNVSGTYKGVVSQSTDGGENWIRHELYSSTVYGYIRTVAVAPSDSDRVFAMGYAGGIYTLYKTENGGTSWSEVSASGLSGTPYDMMIHPADPDRIAIASSSGLYSSDNGGLNWSKVTSSFSTSKNLYQSEALGGLVISTTSGIWVWDNWSGTPFHWGENPGVPGINCALDTAEDVLFAGTSGAAVWTSWFGTGTEEANSATVPAPDMSISPNPVTSGSAVLYFNLPLAGQTTVTLFDLSGRALQEVSSEIMTAGVHELQLNTSDLAPGIYFTRIQSEGFSMSARFAVSR